MAGSRGSPRRLSIMANPEAVTTFVKELKSNVQV
jgi:hypothetical protein